jgi:6-phosphofructo-2-kinase/fructose-2,6-biphosphatase 4
MTLRKQVADACEDTIQKFFDGGGQVVVYDANNGVKANRTRLAEKFDKLGVHVVFLGAAIIVSRHDDTLLMLG